MQGASFPAKQSPSDDDSDYDAERELREYDELSIGASTATGSQASSAWSQQSRKEKDYALEIKEALGVKRGQMLDAEQALILLDAVRAMERNSSITREQITAQVMAYHANKAEERPRLSEEDKSFIPVDPSASGPSVPPEEQPHRSPTATASKTAVTAVEAATAE